MPVTKTAKRALRGSQRKLLVNQKAYKNLELAQRKAKKDKTSQAVSVVFSLADKLAKKKIIHKNKAARIKAAFSKLVVSSKKPSSKKRSSKK